MPRTFNLFKLETTPEELRKIESIVGRATVGQINSIRAIYPEATILEVYLIIAHKQAVSRTRVTRMEAIHG